MQSVPLRISSLPVLTETWQDLQTVSEVHCLQG